MSKSERKGPATDQARNGPPKSGKQQPFRKSQSSQAFGSSSGSKVTSPQSQKTSQNGGSKVDKNTPVAPGPSNRSQSGSNRFRHGSAGNVLDQVEGDYDYDGRFKQSSKLPIYKGNGAMPHHSPHHRSTTPHNESEFCRFHGVSSAPRSHLVPYDIQLQHAAHNCAHNLTPDTTKNNRSTPNSQRNTPFSSEPSTPNGNRRPSSNTKVSRQGSLQTSAISSSNSSKKSQSKFDEYMPLCEIQKALKKGEVVEVSNQRNASTYFTH